MPLTAEALSLMGWSGDGLLYPPLGDFTKLAIFITFGAMLAIALLVFDLFKRAQRRYKVAVIFGFIFLILTGLAYFAFYERYVIVVRLPRLDTSEAVSVGGERTQYANELGNMSDDDLLRYRGADEVEIRKLWTPRSLIKARILLWLSYTFLAVSIVFIVSVFVTQLAHEKSAIARQKV